MRAWAPRVWSFTEAWKASPNDPEKILFISNGYVKRSDAPHNSFGQAQTSSAQLPVPSLINRHLAMRHDCAIVEHIALLNSPDNLREQCLDTYIHTYSTVVPTDSAHHAPGSQWTNQETSFFLACLNARHRYSCPFGKLQEVRTQGRARLATSSCCEPHQEFAGSLPHPCRVLCAGGPNWP